MTEIKWYSEIIKFSLNFTAMLTKPVSFFVTFCGVILKIFHGNTQLTLTRRFNHPWILTRATSSVYKQFRQVYICTIIHSMALLGCPKILSRIDSVIGIKSSNSISPIGESGKPELRSTSVSVTEK